MSRGDSVVAAPPLTPMKSCLSDKSHFGLKMGMVGCPMLLFFFVGLFFFFGAILLNFGKRQNT